MSVVTDAALLARKDLVVELRARHAIAAAFALGGVSLVLVALAVGPDIGRLRAMAPALVWIVLAYASVAVGERLDQVDRADDAFSGLWLVLEDPRAIFLGRVLSLSVVLVTLQVALWLAAFVLLDLAASPDVVLLVPVIVLSGTSAAAVTAIVMALVGGAAHRALLAPTMLLPLLVPTFLAGVQASTALLAGTADIGVWVATVVIESVLFVGVGLVVYDVAARPA
jgi:heme exporter protein B